MKSAHNRRNTMKSTCETERRGTRAKNSMAGIKGFVLAAMVALVGQAGEMRAELSPEWVTRVPVGTSLTSGIAGIHVEPDGVSYITGISGPSSNTDITTVSIAADGSIRWSQTWGSPNSGADQ